MNKYLEKIAGLPITKDNLDLVAKTYTNIGKDFVSKQQSGKMSVQGFNKFLGTASRLNKNIPKDLIEDFQLAQNKAY